MYAVIENGLYRSLHTYVEIKPLLTYDGPSRILWQQLTESHCTYSLDDFKKRKIIHFSNACLPVISDHIAVLDTGYDKCIYCVSKNADN